MKDTRKAKRQRVETVFRLNPQWTTARIARASNVSPTLATAVIGVRPNSRGIRRYERSNHSIQKAVELLERTPPVTYRYITAQTGYSHYKLKHIAVQLGIDKERPMRVSRKLASIGNEVGLTRERVRQILKEEGLHETYPAKQVVAKRGGRHLNCSHCNVEISPSHVSSRKSGYCRKCYALRHAKDYEDKRVTLICKGCYKPFTLLKSSYNIRLRRKEEYRQLMLSLNRTVQDTPVSCSYSCSATIRGFGIYVGRANIKNLVDNRKYTPEMLQHVSKLRRDGVAVKDILVSIHKHFRTRISVSTFYGWVRQGKLN